MSVDELIMNFRSALVAVVPAFERVGIGWRREDAYDEWDRVAANLYIALVEEPLRWTLPEPEQERFRLPPYDLMMERYKSTAVIEVVLSSGQQGRILHALGTRSEPFDVCECRVIGLGGNPVSDELESYSLASVHFRLRMTARP